MIAAFRILDTTCSSRGKIGLHNMFVNPDLRWKPTSVDTKFSWSRFTIKNQHLWTQYFRIWNPHLAVNKHLWTFITYTNEYLHQLFLYTYISLISELTSNVPHSRPGKKQTQWTLWSSIKKIKKKSAKFVIFSAKLWFLNVPNRNNLKKCHLNSQ